MSDTDPVRYLEEVSADLVGLMRTGVDPDVVALGEWTTRDVAAHLAGVIGIYAGDVDDSDVASAPDRIARARAGEPHVVAGFALMELLVHGDDIARAAQRPWPMPTEAARAACLHSAWGLPWMLDAARAEGVDASWVVRLRGGGARWFRIHNGTAEVDEWHGQPSDCTILARPSSMLLVTCGRRRHWLEVVKGNLLAWGRRPWIATRIPQWFPNP